LSQCFAMVVLVDAGDRTHIANNDVDAARLHRK
jgi:hypothetical protein